ncbi:hypothetical protein HYV80_03430 [Candidatus Woesearchaeota archaeon]|nr:hypothetical protein [Candidatus Woesearchaeota archaeon]
MVSKGIISRINTFKKRIRIDRCIFLLFLSVFFYVVLLNSNPQYKLIGKFTDAMYLRGGFNITKTYELDEPKPIEDILSIFIDKLKFKEICFQDNGSTIKEEAFKGSTLLVIAEYNNQEGEIAFISNRNSYQNLHCFPIVSNNINYILKFDSTNDITSGFARDIPEAIISPNVSVYLKISYLYYIGLLFLVFLYCGLFFIAILKIRELILK